MRIMVTGGAGFIGSNLVERLLKDKTNEIVVIDNLSTGLEKNIESFFKCDNFKFLKNDITKSSIVKLIKDLDVQEIYNLACPASPQYYLEYPIETWEASVLGIRNILKAIKGTNIKLFHSSTSEVYGDAMVYPQTEEYFGNVNPNGVRACYDEGKRAAEALIYDYIRKYDVDVRVARIFNTYGPKMKESDGRVISNFVVQALLDKDITIYGTGEQTRSFCYVDDTVDCIIDLMKLKNRNEKPINIGNPYELSVKEVANIIKKQLKSNSKIVYLKSMSDDPQKRRPDISKAKLLLNWEPKTSFSDGLSKTIDYLKTEIKK